ncbi:MAG: hypothetical protein ACE5EK_03145 [Nitrospinales bacterium]
MMEPVQNKPFIDKCIVSFSHNRHPSRKQADQLSIEKARREMAEGKQGISHLILRAEDDKIDRLKFLFPVFGIPIMCYSLVNLIHSSLAEIVVIGSVEVKMILDHFLEIIGSNGKSIQFVNEDPQNLNLGKTLVLGWSKLSLTPNELVLFQPGDLPFAYDLEKVLRDDDLRTHNLILWMNSRQKMFPRRQEDPESEFVQRNYHYRVIDEMNNEVHDLKEPNVYPINLSGIEQDIIDLSHETRKDGKVFQAGLQKALRHPSRLCRMLPVMAHQWIKFDADLKRLRGNDDYKFGMHRENFNRGASTLLNTPTLLKINDDPAFVSDVDALEDWEDFESLTHFAHKKQGEDGLSAIHPYGAELLRFKERAMPRLRKILPIYRDFPQYMNQIYRSLEMPGVRFDEEGKYIHPSLQTPKVEKAYDWYSQKSQKILSYR